MVRRKSLARRIAEGYLGAAKRPSDMIYRVPGGDNPFWPDPPRVPDPPGPVSRPRHDPRAVVDASTAGVSRMVLLVLALIAIGFVMIALTHH